MAKVELLPFRMGTRKRRQFVTSVNYTGTAAQQRPAPILLPNVGMLSRLILEVHGNVDLSGAGAVTVDGLAGLFNRIQVSANLGSALLFDCSGPGADVAARWENPFAARGEILNPAATGPWDYQLPINIAANRKKNFWLGVINMQDPEIQVNLILQFNPLASVISTATSGGTSSLTVTVWYEYWDIPDPRRFALPPRAIVRTLEESFPNATVVGDNIYTVPRLGTMIMWSGMVYANAIKLTKAQLDAFKIRFNKTDIIEERSGRMQAILDLDDFGVIDQAQPGAVPFPTGLPILEGGTFTWNGFEAEDVPSNGDFRDAIDTLELTTTEFILTVAAGTTVAATDQIRAIRRVAQRLG